MIYLSVGLKLSELLWLEEKIEQIEQTLDLKEDQTEFRDQILNGAIEKILAGLSQK
jgi:hypothetical protein